MSDNRPREFWITRNGFTNNDRISTVEVAPVFKDDVVIHVIEYSAVQRLEARIQKLREALKDIHANCKSPDCYFEECKTAKEALQADDEDSKR